MIPFYRDFDNRQELIADMIGYLKAMTRKKIPGR